jgi:hypothetical protein
MCYNVAWTLAWCIYRFLKFGTLILPTGLHPLSDIHSLYEDPSIRVSWDSASLTEKASEVQLVRLLRASPYFFFGARCVLCLCTPTMLTPHPGCFLWSRP